MSDQNHAYIRFFCTACVLLQIVVGRLEIARRREPSRSTPAEWGHSFFDDGSVR